MLKRVTVLLCGLVFVAPAIAQNEKSDKKKAPTASAQKSKPQTNFSGDEWHRKGAAKSVAPAKGQGNFSGDEWHRKGSVK